ncbi:MAG: hypothetical protein ACREUG_12780 [Steroidobacteraceae bacterium]
MIASDAEQSRLASSVYSLGVENQVGNVCEWVFNPKLRFTDLAALNAHLAARCLELARERPILTSPSGGLDDGVTVRGGRGLGTTETHAACF